MFLIVPPPLGGTVGERTAMLNSFEFTLSVRTSAEISPPPLSEILFLHRFEQEEVGRWSRQKGKRAATSCSLFCDTETVQRSVLRTALSSVCHSQQEKSYISDLEKAPKWTVFVMARNNSSQGTSLLTPVNRYLPQQFKKSLAGFSISLT